MRVGARVEVRNRFDGRWSHGFVVTEVVSDGDADAFITGRAKALFRSVLECSLPHRAWGEALNADAVRAEGARLVFDDLHSTGIYSWDYLAELGRGHASKWRDYLDELAAKGMSREPAKRS